MIRRATGPSAKRDKRDRRSLCWAMRSLVDGTELEPFIDGIPDVLWGPSGRKYQYDHLIRALLDAPDGRLGDRLLDLMRHSHSGLLAPDVELRYKIACLKALWSICTLSTEDASLHLPFHALSAQQLGVWDYWSPRSINVRHRELHKYMFPARALLGWSMLRSFDILTQNLKSDLQKLEADVQVGSVGSFDAVRMALDRMLQDSWNFSIVLPSTTPRVSSIDEEAVRQLSACISSHPCPTHHPGCRKSGLFSATQKIIAMTPGTSFYPHFCKTPSVNRMNRIHCTSSDQPSRYSSPSCPHPRNVEWIRTLICFRGSGGWMLRRKRNWSDSHNTAAMVVVMSSLFPIASGSRPPRRIDLDSINTLISYIAAHLYDGVLIHVLYNQPYDATQLWAAITEYLVSNCPRSNTMEATLEVMCGLYRWFSEILSFNPADLHASEPRFSTSSWFNEYTLSTLQSSHICPPYHSMLAIVKTRILLALTRRLSKIYERLAKGEIIAYTPDFRENLTERLRLIGMTPKQDIDESSSTIPQLPPDSRNVVPTQSDWDEVNSFLSHSLLSKSTLGQVLEDDDNFDVEACDDEAEKGARYLHRLHIVSTRFCDAQFVLQTDFLEACSSQTLPYNALNTLTHHIHNVLIPDFSILFTHPDHRNRFANSIQALMKARTTTPGAH
ncbi:hypothetical protein DFH09DRAFT_123268 [Mycena vulgaris]|nr:hypothetical protein DFH09DRAFT_123268 [Mycena vulgaris]